MNNNIHKSEAQEIRCANKTNIEWLHIEYYRISFQSKNYLLRDKKLKKKTEYIIWTWTYFLVNIIELFCFLKTTERIILGNLKWIGHF